MRVRLVATLVAMHGCSSHKSTDDNAAASGSSAPPPADHMVTVPAGTYVASDPIFAPAQDGTCSEEILAKVAPLTSIRWPDRPQEVNAFSIDVNTISCAEYNACVAAGACTSLASSVCVVEASVKVSQAEAYCSWRHAKLPTLLQWQAAARGQQGAATLPCEKQDALDCSMTTASGMRLVSSQTEYTATMACIKATAPARLAMDTTFNALYAFVPLSGDYSHAFRCAK